MCIHPRNLWLRVPAVALLKQKKVWILLPKDWEEDLGTCILAVAMFCFIILSLDSCSLNETGSIQTMRRDLEIPLILINHQLQSNWMMLHGHILRSTGTLSVLLFCINIYTVFLFDDFCSSKAFPMNICSWEGTACHVWLKV